MTSCNLQILSRFIHSYDQPDFISHLAHHSDCLDLTKWNQSIKPGVISAIIDKIIYILMRHKFWCHNEILKDATIDYLLSEFEISRDFVIEVTDSFFEVGARFFDEYREFCQKDKEFVRYIFVECTLLRSEAELRFSLGIGRVLIDKIHKAIDIARAIQLAEATAPLQFLPRLDAMMAEILIEFESECTTFSKRLTFYRLKYSLIRQPAFLSIVEDFSFVEKLNNIFAILTVDREFSKKRWSSLSEEINAVFQIATGHDLLDQLIKCRLIYCVSTHSRNPIYSTSTHAKELYASSIIENNPHNDADDMLHISKLDEVYQFETVMANSNNISFLTKIATSCRPISPRILSHALLCLRSELTQEEFYSLLKDLKSKEKSIFLRNVLNSYGDLASGDADYIDEITNNVAQSTPSAPISVNV